MNLGMAFQKNMVFPASTHSSNNLHVYSPPKKKLTWKPSLCKFRFRWVFRTCKKKTMQKSQVRDGHQLYSRGCIPIVRIPCYQWNLYYSSWSFLVLSPHLHGVWLHLHRLHIAQLHRRFHGKWRPNSRGCDSWMKELDGIDEKEAWYKPWYCQSQIDRYTYIYIFIYTHKCIYTHIYIYLDLMLTAGLTTKHQTHP